MFDVLVVGAGIAGAAAGCMLARAGARTALLERESAPGYHTTGRSAANFSENYGPPTIRRLASASREFFTDPPDGLTDQALSAPRGVLLVAGDDQAEALADGLADAQATGATVERIDAAAAQVLLPVLREATVAAGALYEADARDLDVHAILQAFLVGLRGAGGELVTDAEVLAIERRDGAWRVTTKAGEFRAATVINAAGAWADTLAGLAGAEPIGIVPKRRTVFTIETPAEFAIGAWPLVGDIDERWYAKPDAGALLVSPADATPSPACDAQPEEIDVATGAHRLEQATTLEVRRIVRKWAGLRSFAADGDPVCGWDRSLEGFFWLAGQGGYGITTAPALGRVTAALVQGKPLPDDIAALGLSAECLSPARFAA